LFFGQISHSYAQNFTQIEKRADQAFNLRQYDIALIDYRQLLAKEQQNSKYNFRYGVCLFEIENHFQAAKYFDLVIGLKQEVDPLNYYYRGLIYQEQYFFEAAQKCFDNYQKLSAESKNHKKVSHLIEQTKRAAAEIHGYVQLPLQAIQTTQDPRFYLQYNFGPDDYSFYEVTDLHAKNNLKHQHIPVYAYKRGMKYRILSSYGAKGDNLDLYIQRKDANNNWSEAILIEGGVNSSQSNEAFGFFDPQTNKLYYSSDANSIGGFDLFEASYDLSTNVVSSVRRMPYPYSSPVNDLFYVIDHSKNSAYFATQRQGIVNQFEVYSLDIIENMLPAFVFSGQFSNELEPNSLQMSMTFTDLKNGIEFGPFLTNRDGIVEIALSSAGPFELAIEVEGASRIFTTRFELPQVPNGSQLVQQIRYYNDELGKEKWQVLNLIKPLQADIALSNLSKLELTAAKGQLIPKRISKSNLEPNSPTLAQRWQVQTTDTATFVNLITDSLLAAEVALENQVRLTQLLTTDLEQLLKEREQLLSQLAKLNQSDLTPNELEKLHFKLDELTKVIALNVQWLEVNTAAQIPDQGLLRDLEQINDQNQQLLLKNDTLQLIAGWEEQRTILTKAFQIAAYDNQATLETAKNAEQHLLQQIIELEAANKSQIGVVQKQIDNLKSDLQLQSKKQQIQTQTEITQLERQQQSLLQLSEEYKAKREQQTKNIEVFDQSKHIAVLIHQSEDPSLQLAPTALNIEELIEEFKQQAPIYDQGVQRLNELIVVSKNANPSIKEESSQEESISQNTTSIKEESSQEESISQNTTSINQESSQEESITQETTSIKEESSQEESISQNTTSINQESSKEEPITQETTSINEETSSQEESITQETTSINEETSSQEESITQETTSINEETSSQEVSIPQETTSINEETSSQEESISQNTTSINQESSQEESITQETTSINEVTSSQEESITQETTSINEEPSQEESISQNTTSINQAPQTRVSTYKASIEQLKNLSDEQILEPVELDELGLTKSELDLLDAALKLPMIEVTANQTQLVQLESKYNSDVKLIENYVAYVVARSTFEQQKIQLQANQDELRRQSEVFEALDEEVLVQLLVAQDALVVALEKQKNHLLDFDNQAQLELLIQNNFIPTLNDFEVVQNVQQSNANSNSNSDFKMVSDPQIEQSLPIDLPCPDGLVFRVQVGAFRKPVPADRFREFTPVDGRKLANGLIVYMAGNFRTSAEAMKQQKAIRALGYTDAFIVAYENCERMTLAQGRLKENQQPNKIDQTNPATRPFAEPGQGLYYSVQVGVYNKPLSSADPIGLPELIEARTQKGQYRYASGKFDALAEAKKRQQQAVKKGITDAFIVAYYQGQRIDLARARALSESGVAFEPFIDNKNQKTVSVAIQNQVAQLQIPKTQSIIPPDPYIRYELKCEECTDDLTRLNRVGVFVYNEERGAIQSAIQKQSSFTKLQQLYLKDMRKRSAALKGDIQVVDLAQPIDGAFADWFLRQQNAYQLDFAQPRIILQYLPESLE